MGGGIEVGGWMVFWILFSRRGDVDLRGCGNVFFPDGGGAGGDACMLGLVVVEHSFTRFNAAMRCDES